MNKPSPIVTEERCPYGDCAQPQGAEHLADCVCRRKVIVVRLTVQYCEQVPESWDKHMIEFKFNESSSCSSNQIHNLADLEEDESHTCPCQATFTDYVRDATDEDMELGFPALGETLAPRSEGVRMPGFYWVRVERGWIIAEWADDNFDRWGLPGTYLTFPDNELLEIDECRVERAQRITNHKNKAVAP